jgi:hypothetical protein
MIGSDLTIEQLHELADWQRGEIERLQAELAEAQETAHYANGVADLAMKHRDAAEADAARLRSALEPFKGLSDGYWSHDGQHDFEDEFEVARIGMFKSITVGHLRAIDQALATSPAVTAAAGVIRAAVKWGNGGFLDEQELMTAVTAYIAAAKENQP